MLDLVHIMKLKISDIKKYFVWFCYNSILFLIFIHRHRNHDVFILIQIYIKKTYKINLFGGIYSL